MDKEMEEIYAVLYDLGITVKYRGFFHAAYAVALALKQPERLIMVTKWLYPEVARRYDSNWNCVERNIRTVANMAWKNNRAYLEQLAHMPLTKKPTTSEFIGILVAYISNDNAA